MWRQGSLLVVELTPPGRGAVSTLLVEGSGALQALRRRLRTKSGRPLPLAPCDQPVFARFGPPPGEEVVVRCRSSESVELHCHGGLAATAMIEKSLAAAGCQTVPWGQWLAGYHVDPITAAAHAALAEASTERTATILLDQYQGALRRALREIHQAIDRHDIAAARQQIAALLALAPLGLHLVRPWQVVIAGRPNVGKSSLINALVGYPRAIVHPTPGTTRDVVSVHTAFDGWPVELSDTAGLQGGGGSVERAGIQRAREKLATADLLVLLFDQSVAWSAADRDISDLRSDGLVVHNKSDLAPAAGPRPAGIAVSALSGQGITDLARAIADRLVPDPPPPAAAVPFAPEHVAEIRELSERIAGS